MISQHKDNVCLLFYWFLFFFRLKNLLRILEGLKENGKFYILTFLFSYVKFHITLITHSNGNLQEASKG